MGEVPRTVVVCLVAALSENSAGEKTVSALKREVIKRVKEQLSNAERIPIATGVPCIDRQAKHAVI